MRNIIPINRDWEFTPEWNTGFPNGKGEAERVELPHTGGVGTWMYTTGGIMLVCIAVLTLCINLKRRRCERRKE